MVREEEKPMPDRDKAWNNKTPVKKLQTAQKRLSKIWEPRGVSNSLKCCQEAGVLPVPLMTISFSWQGDMPKEMVIRGTGSTPHSFGLVFYFLFRAQEAMVSPWERGD